MNSIKSLSILIFILLVGSLKQSQAQTVSGVQAAIVNGKIEITFRMTNLVPGQRFSVRLYSSVDNYGAAITKNLSGDIGDNVGLVTVNKIVMDDPIGTLGEVTGDLNFKVRALLTYNPVVITSPTSAFKQKRKRNATITWTGGLPNDQVSVDLYRNDILLRQGIYSATSNATKRANFKFPKVDKGAGYTMKISFTSIEKPIDLPEFKVKPRTSMFGKLIRLGILVVGADLAYGQGEITLFGFLSPNTLPEPPGFEEFDNNNNK